MKYPKLVPKSLCKIPIVVCLESEGLSHLGEPLSIIERSLMCNFQDSATTVLTMEKKIVEVRGVALFDGDIAPELANISSGHVVVFGEERRIASGMKARNPDGTVNYTRLEVV